MKDDEPARAPFCESAGTGGSAGGREVCFRGLERCDDGFASFSALMVAEVVRCPEGSTSHQQMDARNRTLLTTPVLRLLRGDRFNVVKLHVE